MGLPYKDQIEELFIVIVLFCIFPTWNNFNFLIGVIFELLHFSKAWYSLFVVKVQLNCNESV